jgi:hypothetical protein
MQEETGREKSVQEAEGAEDKRAGDECNCRLESKIEGIGGLFI